MTRRRFVLAASLAAAAVGTVGIGIAVAEPSGPSHYQFFEQQTSLVVTPAGGAAGNRSSQGPGPGDSIEFTSLDFRGNHVHHAGRWTASDHFICHIDSQGIPTCDGQLAMGASMILVHGTGGQGDFSLPVTGGTGNFRNARGTMHVHDLANSDNADLEITLK